MLPVLVPLPTEISKNPISFAVQCLVFAKLYVYYLLAGEMLAQTVSQLSNNNKMANIQIVGSSRCKQKELGMHSHEEDLYLVR
jgi:hypothetical protein